MNGRENKRDLDDELFAYNVDSLLELGATKEFLADVLPEFKKYKDNPELVTDDTGISLYQFVDTVLYSAGENKDSEAYKKWNSFRTEMEGVTRDDFKNRENTIRYIKRFFELVQPSQTMTA